MSLSGTTLSTGKTTFIKHLLGTEYPGCNIGPEPTTDRFVVVMHGEEGRGGVVLGEKGEGGSDADADAQMSR